MADRRVVRPLRLRRAARRWTSRVRWAALGGTALALVLVLAALLEGGASTSVPDRASTAPPSAASPTPTRSEPQEPAQTQTQTQTPTPPPSPAPTPPPPPSTPSEPPAEPTVDEVWADALQSLASIPVKGRAPKTGYDRDGQFGDAWIDVDRNGCDTRNDILRRDLIDIVVDGRCRVLTGTLIDPFTGQAIAFVRGQTTSSAVQIDHVVALLNAWETGAQQLTPDARVRFANDPRNLLAVDGPTNARKGAGDAATWLPPNRAFRCDYVSMQVEVKAAYGLWVTAAERDAITRVLEGCLAR